MPSKRTEARLPCFDLHCPEPARYRLLDINMCADHYIEALEHSAHIVVTPLPQLRAIAEAENRTRVEALAIRVAKRAAARKERVEQFGTADFADVPADSI